MAAIRTICVWWATEDPGVHTDWIYSVWYWSSIFERVWKQYYWSSETECLMSVGNNGTWKVKTMWPWLTHFHWFLQCFNCNLHQHFVLYLVKIVIQQLKYYKLVWWKSVKPCLLLIMHTIAPFTLALSSNWFRCVNAHTVIQKLLSVNHIAKDVVW